jgi:hypothetical protein
MDFAQSKSFNNVHVVINGKKIGTETKLTCAKMKLMKPIPLPSHDVKLTQDQMNIETTNVSRPSGSEDDDEDDEDLQKALRMSLGENISDEDQILGDPNGQQFYEEFMTHLFSEVLALFTNVVKQKKGSNTVGPIVNLLLDLVLHTKSEHGKIERATKLSKELAGIISYILTLSGSHNGIFREKSQALVVCARAYSTLMSKGTSLQSNLLDNRMSGEGYKSNPAYVCKVHNIPAVRRRSSNGPNKGKRFYVCAKPRGLRCNYFVWADEANEKAGKSLEDKTSFQKSLQPILWNHFSEGQTPLHMRLCEFLEQEIFHGDQNEATPENDASPSEQEKTHRKLKSCYDEDCLEHDMEDGVLCSRERLLDLTRSPPQVTAAAELPDDISVLDESIDYPELLLQSSLDLVTSMADYQTEGISRWFSFLCEISLSKSKKQSVRAMAKKALKTLCGENSTMYHSVRDHFAFGFQLRELFQHASSLLTAALKVKEKARLCGEHWTATHKSSWDALEVGGLIGVQELIPEDCYAPVNETKIGEVLDEIWTVIKSRGQSWRQFCGLKVLPTSHREPNTQLILSETPPIVALFYLACSLTGSNQVKTMGLIELALPEGSQPKLLLTSEAKDTLLQSSNDGDLIAKSAINNAPISLEGAQLYSPEKILLSGERRLTVEGFVGFAIQYVLNGRSSPLRKVAHRAALKLAAHLSTVEAIDAFVRLFNVSVGEIGDFGRSSTEFMNLLQLLACRAGPTALIGTSTEQTMHFFIEQMKAIKCDRSNGEWSVLEHGSGSSQKTKVDAADCVCCWRTRSLCPTEGALSTVSPDTTKITSPPAAARPTRSSTTSQLTNRTTAPQGLSNKKWHPEQVSPFVRGRLDGGKERSKSNEFCSFFTLKYRLAISDIHLTINDPRGRFVKTITIFYAPRPVSDVNNLKSDGFLWQKCATIKLNRGATKATVSLKQPIVAANIKVEYTDFYERPGGTKASDGSFIVYCPRCTRTVTNAHGVCGHCGEVAFQCRKCRHINYDRLDAFLCVECGFCAAGSFSFELTAGVASNAVAITNDEEFMRASRMLSAAESIHEELRNKLRETMGMFLLTKNNDKNDGLDSIFNLTLKRALLGLPPEPTLLSPIPSKDSSKGPSALDKVDRPGSVVKFVTRPDSSHGTSRHPSSSTTDRTRSLIRLARQIRSESSGSNERLRSGDVVVRHLGRGVAADGIHEDSDLLDLLEGGGLLREEGNSRLSRVVSQAQGSSRAGISTRTSLSQEAKRESTGSKKSKSTKQLIEECKRLHTLMREAEREAYEIRRRVEAWQRLERNELSQPGDPSLPSTDLIPFYPSHCSSCNISVALQLLILWLRLFQAHPSEVQIPHEFLNLLFEDFESNNKHFTECKRQVVKEIATKSKLGAKLVLEELRKRLKVMHDPACAEILGKIMQEDDFEFADDYRNLALEILASNGASLF